MSDSANSVIVNFDEKRSIPKEIPPEVEVYIVKMIVITRDDCSSLPCCFSIENSLFKNIF